MIVELPATAPPADQLGHVHFVGIGGAGMSGIARILLARGMTVSGSDAKDSRTLGALRALGAVCHVGHDAAHVADADTVVVSTAIRANNPEVVEAYRRGVRVLPRAAALASVMSGRRGVVVTGTHGKTTTTSMLTVALQHCGVDPSFAIGGDLNESGANAHNGSGDIFVAEADESDGSFLAYSPEVAIVTNIEADHLDNFGSSDAYQQAFYRFVDRIEPGGFLVVCADDPGARRLGAEAQASGVDVRSYGENPAADVRVTRSSQQDTTGSDSLDSPGASWFKSAFDVQFRDQPYGSIPLRLPGWHNALNAAAALTAGLGLGVSFECLRDGLAGFTGTRRRFELRGVAAGVRVYDDYAHHPTEVRAVLQAARTVVGDGRIIAVFQPHLYSRTRFFAAEFGQALALADEVIVMDVYAAREDPEPGVTGALIAGAVPLPSPKVRYEPSWSAVPKLAGSLARSGDMVLTIGAGDVTMIGPEVLELLAASAATVAGMDSTP
jgi:UDP-N-acetylmuramate--alanine ligase